MIVSHLHCRVQDLVLTFSMVNGCSRVFLRSVAALQDKVIFVYLLLFLLKQYSD